ncbi:RNA polymerase sigma factor [Paludisphaera rhizosphaerae]|uniref:RNA polymerase sigma factor n=1 Tax=Paludisphaera rhizosphaerae TaxID=2711216 RepID=UPI0013EA0AB2|nr:sigma-70 family RNA polymerase sigma factor [Paludisphaera rhizosphaerae]
MNESSPRPDEAPGETAAAEAKRLQEEGRRQIANLLRSTAAKRPWIQSELDDAENEVVLILLDRVGSNIWEDLSPRKFGSEAARQARRSLFQAVQIVSDRLRNRRRVEIKPGDADYDPDADKTRRQRRTIAPDWHLGDDAERVVDDAVEDGVRIDVRTALDGLQPQQRRIVVQRVVQGLTWEQIAAELKVTASQARSQFSSARSVLADWLRAYSDDL